MKRVGSTGVQGFFAALLIHVLGIGGLFVISPREQSRASIRPPVRVRVANRPKPPPTPVEVEPPEVKEPIVVEPEKPLRRKPAIKKKKAAPAKTQPAPSDAPAPVDASPDPPQAPSTPRRFTVAMEATVPGGGVAVPASPGGGWAFGAPDGDPQGEKVLAGPEPAPAFEKKPGPPAIREAAGVTRLPKLVSQPSSLDMRAAYPEAARREGREANVYLKILVTADGKVARVRVLRGSGEGFDRAAEMLVRRFRFRPAEAEGRPVSVWIPWTYKFRLEA